MKRSSEEETDTHETADGEDSTQESNDLDQDEIRRNRIKLVTKSLIDSKYSLMDDVNYNRGFSKFKDEMMLKENGLTPPSDEASSLGQNGPIDEISRRNLRATIPKSTRIKADRVRIYLDNFYNKLEGCICIEHSEHLHEGVEGVYNPLQVIRNRKLKKKYGEMPAKQFLKPPLIAVLDFSKKPHKRMPWFVDASESASDMTWRTSHWDELVDPHGHLWFGEKDSTTHFEGPYNKAKHENEPNKKNHRHNHHGKHHHHHLRMPHQISLYHSRRGSAMGTTDYNNTADDGDINGIPTGHNKISKPFSEKELTGKEVNNLSPAEYADEESLLADDEKSRLSRFEMMIKKPKWPRSPRRGSDHSSTEKLIVPMHHTRTASTAAGAPRHSLASASSGHTSNFSTAATVPNNSVNGNVSDPQAPKGNLLSAVTIHRLRNPGAEVSMDDEEEETRREIDPLHKESFELIKSKNGYRYAQVDAKLQEQRSATMFLMGAIKVVRSRKMTNDIIKRRSIQKRKSLQRDENMPPIVNNTSDMLKTYNQELERALKKGNNYASSLLNDYSMRVETLISTSDRILSDINTTLTLKLKAFQESADKFGSLRMMRGQKLTKFFYTVLEITIVIICWTIWLAVSILKCAKLGAVFTIRLLKWMLW